MQQLELDFGNLNTIVEVDPWSNEKIREAIEDIIAAAIEFAYCPDTGGFAEVEGPNGFVEYGPSIEDACENIKVCVDRLIYEATERGIRGIDESKVHTVMDLPMIQLRYERVEK